MIWSSVLIIGNDDIEFQDGNFLNASFCVIDKFVIPWYLLCQKYHSPSGLGQWICPRDDKPIYVGWSQESKYKGIPVNKNSASLSIVCFSAPRSYKSQCYPLYTSQSREFNQSTEWSSYSSPWHLWPSMPPPVILFPESIWLCSGRTPDSELFQTSFRE